MSQQHLEYAGPSLPHRSSLLCIQPSSSLFWTSIALLAVTVIVMALPNFRPLYSGPMHPVAWSAEFVVLYGRWISAVFASITLPSRWLFGCVGWPSKVARCIAAALLVFYWVFAPGDGAYSHLLYGACP